MPLLRAYYLNLSGRSMLGKANIEPYMG